MSAKTRPLHGKVALVTGAARGIGRAAAIRLSADGTSVIVFDRLEATATIAEIQHGGTVARGVTGSVANEADVLRLFERVAQQEERLDIVVNCAGMQVIRPLLESTVADYTAVTDVNLKGTLLVSREAVRMMLR